jgi:serine/threonine-protein kinase RsbW
VENLPCVPAQNGWQELSKMSSGQKVDKPLVLSLESALESVDQAEEEVVRFATEAGFGEEDLQKVGMAVRECLVNAVLHGNQYDPDKRAGVRVEIQNGGLVITVTDEGAGFEMNEVPDPLAQENLLRHSGRGLFLIRAFMDDLQVRRRAPRGTEVRMVKYRTEESNQHS